VIREENAAMATLVQDELAYHIFIQATAQDVWDALTRPGWTQKYGYRARVRYDPQPGGIYLAYASGRRNGQRVQDLIIGGEVLEAEPPKRLVQTWHPMFDARLAAEPATRLSWEIHEEQTGLTAVTIRHECSGAPQAAALAAGQAPGRGGWSWVLSDLKTLLETGRPLTAWPPRGEDRWHTLS
jgi:uncharacterized protein YndB with AHSA1/START domain